MKSIIKFLTACTVVFVSGVFVSGCDSQVGSTDESTQSLRLSMSISPGALGKSGVSGFTQTDGTNTIELTSVGIVIEKIELERADSPDCDDSVDLGHDGEDDCEEFEVGPILLEPGLDGVVEQVVVVNIPVGFYEEIEFEVHKVSSENEEEADFVLQNPDFDGISIRVEGQYNGEDFVFTQDLDEEQEIEFDTPFEVSVETGPTNLTLNLDLSTWFTTPSGVLVDPSTASKGGENEGLVEENIKRSIDVFEDDDEDGIDDEIDDDIDND